MTASEVFRLRRRPGSRSLLLAFVLLAVIGAVAAFVSYLLWPTWSAPRIALDAPALPVTIGGVLFNVPPAAIRVPVQRHPGAHERIDLVFVWPSLTPPVSGQEVAVPAAVKVENDSVPVADTDDRLFVTIAGLGSVLAPIERLRSIYPRYFEARATAGPDDLAVLPFRAGTPYEGEDLIYFAEKPEQFFARCTRPLRTMSGTCVHERLLGTAGMTLRFPRQWLSDWRSVAAGFDRLIGELHAAGG